jgi:probable phosphoglycerate mutase
VSHEEGAEVPGQIVLIRHGQTLWSLSGQHTGRTDIPLTPDGESRADALAPALSHRSFGLQLCSPLQRAQQTALRAGLAPTLDADLLEWDYGAWEGRTTSDIRQELGDENWVIWDHPIPSGETPGEQPDDVAARTQRVIDRCLPVLEAGQDCVLIAHGHVLRILTATWLGLPAIDGRLWTLDAGCVSTLGFERTQHVITHWNVDPSR